MKLCRKYGVLKCRCSDAGTYTVLTLMCLYLRVWDCKKLQVSVARRTLLLNQLELAVSSQATLNLMVVGHCWFESFHWKLTDHSGIWPNSSNATLYAAFECFWYQPFRGSDDSKVRKRFLRAKGSPLGVTFVYFHLCMQTTNMYWYIYIYCVAYWLIDQQWWIFIDFQEWPHGACGTDFLGHVFILQWGWVSWDIQWLVHGVQRTAYSRKHFSDSALSDWAAYQHVLMRGNCPRGIPFLYPKE